MTWLRRVLVAVPVSVALAILLAPEGRLACAEPYVREPSPDGAWTLTLCRRPVFWAMMPGQSSDAPGWLVLRDRQDAIRGVADIAMVQLHGAVSGIGTEWAQDRVRRILVFEIPLVPAANPALRWLDDRIWRLRALLGIVPREAT